MSGHVFFHLDGAPDDPECQHDQWGPAGMFGPYPVEGCPNCNLTAILDTDPDLPPPGDVILTLLRDRGLL